MKRIGIIVVAYNAASTLAKVLDRIPPDFVPHIDQILICDNASEDQTYLVGLGYKQMDGRALPLNVMRNPRNLGYGGNQKVGYDWAIEQGLDIVVLLHADGQYAPEFLPQIVAPLEAGEADAVFGSRMMTKGGARRGGMPLYKLVGNKILTAFENRVVGTDLSEWHSGYRAYSVATLREIPFHRNTDEYDFDTEIIVQLHEAGKRIVELPIPTYYGEEISYVNGMHYAKDIVLDVLRYRVHKIGLGSGETAFATSPYEPKGGPDTAVGRMLAWMSGQAPERVMVVVADDGALGAELTARGHDVAVVRPAPAGPADGTATADTPVGRPRRRARRGRGHRLRHDPPGRRARPRAAPRRAAARRQGPPRAGRSDPDERAELRPLVPAGARRRRALGLRRARDPRSVDGAVLRPARDRAALRDRWPDRPAPGARRAPAPARG